MRTWQKLVLGVSLLCNVVFVLGYFVTAHIVSRLSTPEGRAEFLARRMKLDERQHETFMTEYRELMSERGKLLSAHGPEIQEFWDELTKEHPDPQAIQKIVDHNTEIRHQLTSQNAVHLIRFMSILSPEQRREFAESMKEKGAFSP